jgi:hypothetical protein
MTWKNFISHLAITRRRRVVATALMYGLSLSVHFTSAAGEEMEVLLPAAQSTRMSIATSDGSETFYSDWSLKTAQPIAFQHGWAIPMPSTPSCSSHP